jgi:hypothetical protein
MHFAHQEIDAGAVEMKDELHGNCHVMESFQLEMCHTCKLMFIHD